MEVVRQSWTDERLDDFRGQVNRRFDKVDQRFDKVEGDIESGFDTMSARFDPLRRMMLQASVVVIVALLGLLGTQL